MLIQYPTNSFVFTQPTRWVGWVGVQFAHNISRERQREMAELSMTKPVLLPLIANFEPSPHRYIILQSVNLSLRRKVFIEQFYRGRDVLYIT